MAVKFGNNLDLVKNQLLNATIQNLSATPGGLVSGDKGRVWFNTTDNFLYYWDGTAAIPVNLGTGSITSAQILNGTIVDADINAAAAIAFTKLAAPSADFSMNTHKITNVVDPGSAQDAATKNYVDTGIAAATVKAIHDPVFAAENILNVNIASPGSTIDGGTPSTGDRILLAAQSTLSQNGVWVYNGSGSALTRPTDWATGKVISGTLIPVLSGTSNQTSVFEVITNAVITVGTTAIQLKKVGGQRLDELRPAANPVDFNSQAITSLANPTNAQDGATKSYVDTADANAAVKSIHDQCKIASATNTTIASPGATIDGVTMVAGDRVLLIGQSSGAQNGLWVWNGAAVPMTRPTDANTSAKWVDGMVVPVSSTGSDGIYSLYMGQLSPTTGWVLGTNGTNWYKVAGQRLNELNSPNGNVSLGSNKLTSVLDPTSAQDAATKTYVDSVAAGLDPKASVRGASTANITISPGGASLVVDGVTYANGERILLKNQTTQTQNGIYVVGGVGTSVTLTRSGDADTSAEVNPGMFMFVEEGTLAADTAWILTTNGPITLGSTNLVFSQFAGPGSYTAGSGLTLTGTQFSIAAGAITNAMLAGSIDAGTKLASGTSVPTANGGTGSVTVSGARVNLKVPLYFNNTFGDGTTTAYTFTSGTTGLATADALVQIWDITSNPRTLEMVDVSIDNTTFTITVTYATAPASNTRRITVLAGGS